MKSLSAKLIGLGAFIFALLGIVSCNNQIDSDSPVNYLLANALSSASEQSQFGSLSIIPEEVSRSLSDATIKYAKAIIYASDISSGSEPKSEIIEISADGKGSLEIYQIPVGKNRIIQVTPYSEDGTALSERTIRCVMDIKSGKNEGSVTKETTALGNVFYSLYTLGHQISGIQSTDKACILNAIDPEKSFEKINTAMIALDYYKGGVNGLKTADKYVIGSSAATSVVVHAYGYPYVWYWASGAKGSLAEMTDEGNGYYSYTFENTTDINVIFRKKGGEDWSGKTEDLSRTAGVWYYKDSKWTGSSSSDTTAPEVSFVTPSVGKVLSGDVELYAFASDESGIESVEYFIDGKSVGTVNSGNVAFHWDSTEVSNGSHSVYAIAKDTAGNTNQSESITFTTSNKFALKAVISSTSSAMATVSKTFNGSTSTGEIASYSWSFGDGSTGTGTNPSHTYTSKGKYTVVLTITGTDGTTSAATQIVNVTEKSDFQHRDFREETVYFMMTDRFADGDKTNNNIWGDEYLPNGEADLYKYDEDKTGVLSYYHGGDFKGIINNLDYIADMGFTAIWITPSVKQPEGRFFNGRTGNEFYEASAFHGYWGYDFDQIDPHLHSSGKNSDGWDDFKAFVDACHAKGIRVMQDIVLNHGNHSAGGNSKWANYSVQTIMDGKKWAWQTLDPYYEEVPVGAVPSKNGFYSYYGFGQCSDLIDFGHLGENGKDSRHHLINVYKKFIEAGVDAFRIDTMAYIPNEFAGEFADAMYNYAKELGNDYFYMIGEAWCGRYDAVARHSLDKTDSLHMLDMHLSCLDYPGEMYKVFGGNDSIGSVYNNATGADNNFKVDGKKIMTPDEYTKTAMFVDNHDSFRCNGRFSEAQYKNALNYIYLFRGVPIVYYGTEACYSWEGAHASTNKEDVVARWMLGDVGINYVKANKPTMYKHLKVLNELYHASECIQKGAQDNLSIGTIPAAFTREWNGKKAAVILNHQSSEGSYSFSNLPAGSYTLYTSSSDGILNKSTVSVNGSYSLKAPANGFAVLDPQM